MLNLESSDHRTLLHFETVHFKWALTHRTQRRFGPFSHMASFLHDVHLYLAFADGMADSIYRQWFLEVFLDPFSNVNDRIMPLSDAVSSSFHFIKIKKNVPTFPEFGLYIYIYIYIYIYSSSNISNFSLKCYTHTQTNKHTHTHTQTYSTYPNYWLQ